MFPGLCNVCEIMTLFSSKTYLGTLHLFPVRGEVKLDPLGGSGKCDSTDHQDEHQDVGTGRREVHYLETTKRHDECLVKVSAGVNREPKLLHDMEKPCMPVTHAEVIVCWAANTYILEQCLIKEIAFIVKLFKEMNYSSYSWVKEYKAVI